MSSSSASSVSRKRKSASTKSTPNSSKPIKPTLVTVLEKRKWDGRILKHRLTVPEILQKLQKEWPNPLHISRIGDLDQSPDIELFLKYYESDDLGTPIEYMEIKGASQKSKKQLYLLYKSWHDQYWTDVHMPAVEAFKRSRNSNAMGPLPPDEKTGNQE